MMIKAASFANLMLPLVILLITLNFFADSKVKCHECQDMENGWCPQTSMCEDTFCFKANATLNQGHKQLQLGCIANGAVGCWKQELQVPGMMNVWGDYCVCSSDFCNAVARPSSAVGLLMRVSEKFGSSPLSNLDQTCLWTLFTVIGVFVRFGFVF